MNIGQKIAVVLLVVSATMVGLFVTIQRPMLIEKFKSLQSEKAKEDIARSQESIQSSIDSLNNQAQDWGSWDDTYQYVQGKNPRFKDVNLTDGIYDTSHIDLIFLMDYSGKTVFGAMRTPEGKIQNSATGFDPEAIALGTKTKPGPSKDPNHKLKGVVEVGGLPMEMVCRPIRDSDETQPTRGTIILGRFLTDAKIEEFSRSVSVPFTLEKKSNLDNSVISNFENGDLLAQNRIISEPTVGKSIEGYAAMSSLNSGSQYFVHSQTSPEILEEGIASVDVSVVNLALLAFIGSCFGLVYAHFAIASPLRIMANKVSKIDEKMDVDYGSSLLSRPDEIGILARQFLETANRLSTAQERLVQISHEAGMAEVARGMIHNAGNVLNSLSVSVQQIKQKQASNQNFGFRKALDILPKDPNELADFLKNDPKGEKIIPYLYALIDATDEEKIEVQAEIEELTVLVQHMSGILQAQHTLAIQPIVNAPINLVHVLNSALQVVKKSFERHRIDVQINVPAVCEGKGDESKFVQVLVNLLTNAKEALEQSTSGKQKVVITLSKDGAGRNCIVVFDNGIGIEQESLTKIFGQGNSSKDKGIGFGLHFCAIALSEMGWSIEAHSEGKGKGARFVLSEQMVSSAEVAA